MEGNCIICFEWWQCFVCYIWSCPIAVAITLRLCVGVVHSRQMYLKIGNLDIQTTNLEQKPLP